MLADFWEMWDALRDCGWQRKKVKRETRLVRPGCASAYGIEGTEWFASTDAVVEFVKDNMLDGAVARPSGNHRLDEVSTLMPRRASRSSPFRAPS